MDVTLLQALLDRLSDGQRDRLVLHVLGRDPELGEDISHDARAMVPLLAARARLFGVFDSQVHLQERAKLARLSLSVKPCD